MIRIVTIGLWLGIVPSVTVAQILTACMISNNGHTFKIVGTNSTAQSYHCVARCDLQRDDNLHDDMACSGSIGAGATNKTICGEEDVTKSWVSVIHSNRATRC